MFLYKKHFTIFFLCIYRKKIKLNYKLVNYIVVLYNTVPNINVFFVSDPFKLAYVRSESVKSVLSSSACSKQTETRDMIKIKKNTGEPKRRINKTTNRYLSSFVYFGSIFLSATIRLI